MSENLAATLNGSVKLEDISQNEKINILNYLSDIIR
jgi:hypothetical protein